MTGDKIDALCLRAAGVRKRIVDLHELQRQAGDDLHQRRMFGVPAEIVALPVAIGGVQVIDLVGGDGKLHHAGPQLRKHDDD